MQNGVAHTDREIIDSFLRGDDNSFRSLFDAYYNRFCFYAAKIVGDQNAAEDIVQDIFLNLLKLDLSTFQQAVALKAYLYNCVRNRSLNYLRNQKTRQKNSEQIKLQEPDDDHFLCAQIQSEVMAEIFRAVNELPEKCRQIFTMSYVDELSDKQIADELNITLNTIKTQKRRARTYLKIRLGHLFVFAQILFLKL